MLRIFACTVVLVYLNIRTLAMLVALLLLFLSAFGAEASQDRDSFFAVRGKPLRYKHTLAPGATCFRKSCNNQDLVEWGSHTSDRLSTAQSREEKSRIQNPNFKITLSITLRGKNRELEGYPSMAVSVLFIPFIALTSAETLLTEL